MIRRCAWHPKYFGHRLIMGIVDRTGDALQYTDGMCARCDAKFREDHALKKAAGASPSDGSGPADGAR